jgi:hypothetical protein
MLFCLGCRLPDSEPFRIGFAALPERLTVETDYAMWLAPGTKQGRKRTCICSCPSPRPAALLVTATVSTVTLARGLASLEYQRLIGHLCGGCTPGRSDQHPVGSRTGSGDLWVDGEGGTGYRTRR